MNDVIEYIKAGEVVLVNPAKTFIYETCVYAYYHGLFALVNSQQYSSPEALIGVVPSFWKTRHIQICSTLYAAPEKWLRENQFTRYIKPIKAKKPKIKNTQ